MTIELPDGKYIVAVSGGVDSVVLLDMLVRSKQANVTVAHFDHGIRSDSANDERFVAELAAGYGLPYVSRREELGAGASEELARERRYNFLREEAKKRNAKIMTAHHADDVIETMAINIRRGTGWRGLAVLDSPDSIRPLLGYYKTELMNYAKRYHLSWHEDSTNQDTVYLRNRMRVKLKEISEDTKRQLLALHAHQIEVKTMIDQEAKLFTASQPYSRYFFIMVPENVGRELIRSACLLHGGTTPLTHQAHRALIAIKTALPGSRHDIASGVFLEFTRTHFIVKTSGK